MGYKQEIQKERLEYAKHMLEEIGINIIFECESRVEFEFLGETIQFFPFKSWATGKSIKDGRGLKNLLKQLK